MEKKYRRISRIRVFICLLQGTVFRLRTSLDPEFLFLLDKALQISIFGLCQLIFLRLIDIFSGLQCPVAFQIHDRQRPMDPAPVQTTPPIEEDEWGMTFDNLFFSLFLLYIETVIKTFGSCFHEIYVFGTKIQLKMNPIV